MEMRETAERFRLKSGNSAAKHDDRRAERDRGDQYEWENALRDEAQAKVFEENAFRYDYEMPQGVDQSADLQPVGHIFDWSDETGEQNGRHDKAKDSEKCLLLCGANGADKQAKTDQREDVKARAPIEKRERTFEWNPVDEHRGQNDNRGLSERDDHRRNRFSE
jgi:hypothetical protein